jgi:inner membrane protein
MASIGHLAVGAAIGAAYSQQVGAKPRLAIIAFAGLALAPDLDLIGGYFGAIPNTPLAHRGITHSTFFALSAALLAGALLRGSSRTRLLTTFWVFAALGSHGLLDTMSRLGNGPMLFWPFSLASYEFPWRPIPGVLTAQHYMTAEALPTLIVETLLFFPFIAYALTFFLPDPARRVQGGVAPEAEDGAAG